MIGHMDVVLDGVFMIGHMGVVLDGVFMIGHMGVVLAVCQYLARRLRCQGQFKY